MKNPLIRRLVTAALLLILSALPACAGGQGFIEAYESLNGQPVPNHPGSVYQTLRIAEKPQVLEITAEEAAALSGERALLYLGASWCPWCRNALPSLMAAADAEGFSYIYYADLTEERDLFEVIGGEPVKKKPVRKAQKPGRNDPCPCGSGKKFKQCCIGKGIYD